MKTSSFVKLLFAATIITTVSFFACSKNSDKSNSSTNKAQLQISLTDKPTTAVKEVWIDIKQVELIVNDSTHPILLTAIHPGIYNLLALTNGKDTLLADANIPAGTISQIRLILGDSNYVVTATGNKLALKTPSAQQSGLKVQIHQQVQGGMLYRLALDFDAARSIVFAGNSGNVILKPVLRIISFSPSGGNLRGVVIPDSVRTAVLAINGTDTVATTFTDISNGNYYIKDIPAGTYSLSFVPSDTTFKSQVKSAMVTLGQTTVVDTVKLQH